MGGAPKAPAAPDPKETIAAQSAANKESIEAQAKFNRVNEITPTGTLTYTGTPGEVGYTRITALSPEQQRLFDLEQAIGIQSYNLAQNQLGKVGETLAAGFPANQLQAIRTVDESGLPSRIAGLQAENIGAMQKDIEDRAYGEFMRRNEADFEQRRQELRQNLADRGIQAGNERYNREMTQLEREIADAKQGAAYGAFGLGQDYGMQQANYTNQQRQSQLAEALGLQQRERELRTADLQEQKAIRDVPLSDIATLLGYGSPQTPQVSGLSQVNVPTTDAAGIINQNYANQLAAYNARLASRGNTMGSIFGGLGSLGGAAIGKWG